MFGHWWGKRFLFLVHLTPIRTTLFLTSATLVIQNSHGLCKIKEVLPLKNACIHPTQPNGYECYLKGHTRMSNMCVLLKAKNVKTDFQCFLNSFNIYINNQHPAWVTSDFNTSQMSNMFGEVREVPIVSNCLECAAAVFEL